MAHRLIWSLRAADNLESICNRIGEDSDYYAKVFAKRIFEVIKSLPQYPNSGRVVPEFREETLREKIYKNYRIIYEVFPDRIEIITIRHSAMLLTDLDI